MNAWPHTGSELFLGDQRSIGLNQDQEKVECPRAQLYRHAVGDQLSPAQQHLETTEFERSFLRCPARLAWAVASDGHIVRRELDIAIRRHRGPLRLVCG